GGGAPTKQAGSGPQVGAPEGPPPGPPVKVAMVRESAVTDDVTAVGTLLADESVVIRPEIAGRIVKIHFSEGQPIAAGAALVSMDTSDLRAKLAANEADVTVNRQRFDRARNMFGQNFMSQQAVDEANSNLSRAMALKQETLAQLAKAEIRAPFAGTLGLRKVSNGAYLRAGDDIVALEDISALKLDFRVPEVFLSKITKDQDVNVRVDTYPKDTFSGKIYAVEPAVDVQTRTGMLRARIPNPDNKLKPGMFSRVTLILEKRGTALVIPEQAIVPKGNETMVVKVVDGKAEFVPVTIGRRRPGEVEIVKGLAVNDTVVTDGQIKLQPGAPVTVMGSPPPAADQSSTPKS
ncbi:MAG: efflux RND transporter periplasmic adaptor subunit, partial [Pseudomonadota bacterium]|nr:efflux RND transporter periplasmic adaptor subunit [Pseudomonadota bacterium]